jgi:hypothetical protein
MAEQHRARWKSAVAPLAGAAAGFAVGALVGGGRLVRVFDWTTDVECGCAASGSFSHSEHP